MSEPTQGKGSSASMPREMTQGKGGTGTKAKKQPSFLERLMSRLRGGAKPEVVEQGKDDMKQIQERLRVEKKMGVRRGSKG